MNIQIAECSLFVIDEHVVEKFLAINKMYEEQLPQYCIHTQNEEFIIGKFNMWVYFNAHQLDAYKNMDKYFYFPTDFFTLDMLDKHQSIHTFLKKYRHFDDAAYILTHYVFQKLMTAYVKIFTKAGIHYDVHCGIYYHLTPAQLAEKSRQMKQRKMIQALVHDAQIFHEYMDEAVRNATGWMIAHNIHVAREFVQ